MALSSTLHDWLLNLSVQNLEHRLGLKKFELHALMNDQSAACGGWLSLLEFSPKSVCFKVTWRIRPGSVGGWIVHDAVVSLSLLGIGLESRLLTQLLHQSCDSGVLSSLSLFTLREEHWGLALRRTSNLRNHQQNECYMIYWVRKLQKPPIFFHLEPQWWVPGYLDLEQHTFQSHIFYAIRSYGTTYISVL